MHIAKASNHDQGPHVPGNNHAARDHVAGYVYQEVIDEHKTH